MPTPVLSRRPTLLGLAAGLLLVLGAVVLLIVQPRAEPAGAQVSNAGTPPVLAATESRPVPASTAAGPASVDPTPVGPSAGPTPGSQPDSSSGAAPTASTPPALPALDEARPPTAPAAPSAEPVSIELPSIGVGTAVGPVGVTADGQMEVPSDVAVTGWYRFGPAPGDSVGSAVITGHVDSADQGRGAFADLGALEPGDPVLVTDAVGAVHTFQVVSREAWPKDEVPLDRLFDRTGPGRLVLITCGGAFDPQARSYDENIAVTAVPV